MVGEERKEEKRKKRKETRKENLKGQRGWVGKEREGKSSKKIIDGLKVNFIGKII